MVIAIADPLVAGAIFAGFATTWRVFPPAKSLDDLESQLRRFRPSVALVGSSILPLPAALIAFLCAGQLACASETDFPISRLDDGRVVIDHSDLPQQDLNGEMVVATEVIGDPRYAAIVSRQLWISDRSGDPWLHVIDLDADSVMLSFGRAGEGPGDFSEVPQLSTRPLDSAGVWAYDARLRRLTRVSTQVEDELDIRSSLGPGVAQVWSFMWQGRHSIVGIGDMDSNRIVIADSSGQLVRMEPHHLIGPDSAGLESRRSLSSAYVACVQPGEGRLALLYLAAGLVELYGPDGTFTATAKVPFANRGIWAEDARGRLNFSKDWQYYIACTASRRFLYALFAGSRADGPAGPNARASRYVHVFDWDGNLRSILSLDQNLSTIAADVDTVLYGTGQHLGAVFRFRLPASTHLDAAIPQ